MDDNLFIYFFPQGNLHDRYGHIVALSAKFLFLKMEFHAKVTHKYWFLSVLWFT